MEIYNTLDHNDEKIVAIGLSPEDFELLKTVPCLPLDLTAFGAPVKIMLSITDSVG